MRELRAPASYTAPTRSNADDDDDKVNSDPHSNAQYSHTDPHNTLSGPHVNGNASERQRVALSARVRAVSWALSVAPVPNPTSALCCCGFVVEVLLDVARQQVAVSAATHRNQPPTHVCVGESGAAVQPSWTRCSHRPTATRPNNAGTMDSLQLMALVFLMAIKG